MNTNTSNSMTKISEETLDRLVNAVMKQGVGDSRAFSVRNIISALLESGEEVGRGNEQGGELSQVTVKWKEVKPSIEAQKIRSALAREIDSLDEMPDYIWDVVDIAAQLGMNSTKREIVEQPTQPIRVTPKAAPIATGNLTATPLEDL